MARGKTLRWIAALAGAALIATVAYTALRFGGAVDLREITDTEDRPPGVRLEIEGPPGLEETLAAKAEVAEDTPEGQLVLAARDGDFELVSALLAEGLPPDAEEWRNGHRPLHQAADAGQPAIVELLLQAGADPNGRDGQGQTALMRAAAAANLEAGRRLLDAGAEVNDRTEKGDTALIQVVAGSFVRHLQGGNGLAAEKHAAELEFARMLFNDGADPNLHSDEDGSPLKAMAIAQRIDLLTLFVEHGAHTRRDPELVMLRMIPGAVGEALRSARAATSGSPAADEPR